MGQGSNPSMSYGAVRGLKEGKEDILQQSPPPESEQVVDGVADIPDGGYGWVICFTCFFCAIVVDGIPTGIFTSLYHFKLKTSKLIIRYKSGHTHRWTTSEFLFKMSFFISPNSACKATAFDKILYH